MESGGKERGDVRGGRRVGNEEEDINSLLQLNPRRRLSRGRGRERANQWDRGARVLLLVLGDGMRCFVAESWDRDVPAAVERK